MQVNIKAFPGAKKNLIKKEKGCLRVYVTAPAIEGRANKALISILAEYFKVKKRQVQLVKGEKSKKQNLYYRIIKY